MAGHTQSVVHLKTRPVGSRTKSHHVHAYGEPVQSHKQGYFYPVQPPNHQYALPLRTLSHPGLNIPQSEQVTAPEDRLRRKTPAGTFDAAYDGSFVGDTSSHANKHLILPWSSLPAVQRSSATSTLHPYQGHVQTVQQPAGYPASGGACYSYPVSHPAPYFEGRQPLPYPSYSEVVPAHHALFAPNEISYYPTYDQRIPNVAQPPLQTPVSQQHLPAFSNPSYGFYGLSYGPHTGLLDHPLPESSLAQINQNISGLSLTDSVTSYHLSHHDISHAAPLYGSIQQPGVLHNQWAHPSEQSFAARAASASSRYPYTGQPVDMGQAYHIGSPTAPRWTQQVREAEIAPLPKAPFIPAPDLQVQSQGLLSRALTLYRSLVNAIQEARKSNSQSSSQSSRPNPLGSSIYPEPLRKTKALRSFASLHKPGENLERHTLDKQSRSQAHSVSLPSDHPSFPSNLQPLDEHLPSGANSIVDTLPQSDYHPYSTTSRNAPLPSGSAHAPLGHTAVEPWSGLSNLSPSSSVCHLMRTAWNAMEQLQVLCQESSSPWLDGMLLTGCLAHILGNHRDAAQWFRQILKIDASHVEATSNLAATLLACNRRREAEQYWRLTLQLQPYYFDAAEHLIGLLCGDQRQSEAISAVEYIQRSLRVQPDTQPGRSGTSVQAGNPQLYTDLPHPSCYSVADVDQCRIMALVHAKGNILYSLCNQAKAAKAFEEVVMIATGFSRGTLKDLIGLIHSRIRQGTKVVSNREPLLLNPERALLTAKLCFGPAGDLPGLSGVTNKMVRKAAVSVTSNSLLSLAKIYQDGMSSATDQQSNLTENFGIPDILVLYYLSLSLQPSPSTANNVGILLASVQRTSSIAEQARSKENEYYMFPGVVPGSGTALALEYYQYGLNIDAKHAHLYTNLGSLLKDIGQLSMAIKMYEKAVACDGNFDIALANLANAVKDQGKTAEAIVYYRRAVQANPNFAEAVCGLANALSSVCNWIGRGGVVLKEKKFDRWHVDQHGSLLDIHTPGSKGAGWVQKVVNIVDSQLASGETWGRGILHSANVNSILEQLGSLEPTLPGRRTLNGSFIRQLLESWHNKKWEGARVVRFLERAVKLLGRLWYHDKHVKRKQMSPSKYRRPQLPAALSSPSAPTVLPFHTFTLPMSAQQIRLISQRSGLRVSYQSLRAPWLPLTAYPPPSPPTPHLNVGYVSSDFNNHPLAHLMQSVFGMHDERRVQAFCYATTASDKSSHRKQIEAGARVFYDASSWPTERLVEQIVRDGIHVLINLNGYTRGARNEVFAARPAPIQMSFMGFAGSLGAEWCDYLLADEVAIPPETLRPWRRNVDLEDLAQDEESSASSTEWVCSENIIYTRDTFFCCDHRQSNGTDELKAMTWPQEQRRRWQMRRELFPQLPQDAVIYANFNQLYKIDPTTFRTWLRILARVPHAYLWLLRFPDVGEQYLRATASAWAGAAVAERLLFTDVAPKSTHIARACIADLFLDTPECNAHTTAADCLWSGTPLLTLPRYPWKMCSRMAASILGGALPRDTEAGRAAWRELVARDEEAYEETAVRLGAELAYEADDGDDDNDDDDDDDDDDNAVEAARLWRASGRLVELRRLIWSHRWECKLFDTRRWVSDLEAAYEEAWRRWVEGEGGDIWVKDLV